MVSCGATYAPKKVWGFADVEQDGSAHFKVPSGVPIYFMALDKVRFRKPVVPGDQLRLHLTMLRQKQKIFKMRGEAFVEDTLVAEAELLASIEGREPELTGDDS